MDHESYVILKNAGENNIIDREALKRVKHKVVPTIRENIDIILKKGRKFHGLNIRRFTDQFLLSTSPKNRLDEVVVTFLLFLANQISQKKYHQTFFYQGAWESEYAWFMLFKWISYSIFTLIYNVRCWKSEYLLLLDDMVIDLVLNGEVYALRKFAEKISIKFESDEPYLAENHFSKFIYQTTKDFGPYYWRMLHFMAEGIAMRANTENYDINYAKRLWKQFLTETMYRTLLCGYCKTHYQYLLDSDGYKEKILRFEDKDFPMLWFEIHNKVNKNIWKREYSETNWNVDRKFMNQALVAATSVL